MQATIAVPSVWTPMQKILFRFATCFIVLWIFPIHFIDTLVSSMPQSKPKFLDNVNDSIIETTNGLAADLINLLINGIPVIRNLFPPGVTSFSEWSSFAFLFSVTLVSGVGCLLWSLFDRKRKSYNQAWQWLLVFTRYFLASIMLVYGFIKVFYWQMAFPLPSNLVTMMGDYWPQKLAWNFMGYSKTYQIFCGLGEVTGALLLFWRRTTLLGSLILLSVLTVVLMMDLCFDIDAKSEAFVYLLLALFLLLPYRKQLFSLLIKNKSFDPVSNPAIIKNQTFQKAGVIFKYSFIIFIVLSNIFMNIGVVKKYRSPNRKPVLYGIYNTEQFIRNRDTIPLLITDTTIWKQMVFDGYGVTIKKMNDTCRIYTRKIDTAAHTLSIRPYYWDPPTYDTLHKSDWVYEKKDDCLLLKGNYNGDSVQVVLKWYDHEKMRLPSWGFRWITR